MITTIVGDMLPFGEGCETAARAIVAPALLKVDDMVGAVRVEVGSPGNYAPFWP